MGRGGMSREEEGGENMAAWLVGLNTLKIQPFSLPSLGSISTIIPLSPSLPLRY